MIKFAVLYGMEHVAALVQCIFSPYGGQMYHHGICQSIIFLVQFISYCQYGWFFATLLKIERIFAGFQFLLFKVFGKLK